MRAGAGTGGRARQAQGGFAMGSAMRLLESLPALRGLVPANGQWNLGQYLVARGSDLPLRDLQIEVLPPLTPTRSAEGHGGGRDDPGRFRRCSTPSSMRLGPPPASDPCRSPRTCSRGAHVTTLSMTINGQAHGPVEVRDELSMNDFSLREHLGMTGTKFGCGAAQCLSCAIIIDDPDGTSYTQSDLRRPGREFQRQVDPYQSKGTPRTRSEPSCKRHSSVISRSNAAIAPAGFLNEGQVLLERLAKKPVARAELEKVVARGARRASLAAAPATSSTTRPVRDVILADEKRCSSVATK